MTLTAFPEMVSVPLDVWLHATQPHVLSVLRVFHCRQQTNKGILNSPKDYDKLFLFHINTANFQKYPHILIASTKCCNVALTVNNHSSKDQVRNNVHYKTRDWKLSKLERFLLSSLNATNNANAK